jgi:hypothetical protein
MTLEKYVRVVRQNRVVERASIRVPSVLAATIVPGNEEIRL